ncbi:MAG: membrane protein insertase YidC [Gammaproteobacteria bacterium]|nr:membrane protein insertase YidC [Gammaproteobacteria bacterium]
MDLTKFALYTSLAVITYLMLLAWQDDYPPIVEDSTTRIATTQISEPPVQRDADIPTQLPGNSSVNNTDIIAAEVASARTGQLINVQTDTLAIVIDLSGGDIIELALPEYLKQLNVPDDPFVILESSVGRTYVAQSGLIGQDGVDNSGRAVYQSQLNSYQLEDGEQSLIVDLVTSPTTDVTVTKRYTFYRNNYLIDVEFLIDNRSSSPWQANAYGQIKRSGFDDPSNAGGLGRTFLGFVATSDDDPYIKIDFEDIDERSNTIEKIGGWIGFSQHYFISAWVPDPNQTNRFTTRKNDSNEYLGEFTSASFSVPAQTEGEHKIQFYAGPKDQYSLADISPNLDLTIDYGFLWFLAAPIYWLLTRIDLAMSNYGVSIIFLTLTVKAFFYKLSESQYKSMAGMRRLMPKMQQIKDRYGDDKMGLQKATMDLYKKEKINPFGGCLPMLVQMPVFIALYWVLLESVELRHAPFFGWLTDLSVRDPYFILPLLMGATMFLQTKLSPTPADPMQARVMQIMPIMMSVIFLWFPAGLVLYWLTNGLLGILQQWYITRKIEAAYEAGKK